MDNRAEVREFLITRRARTPDRSANRPPDSRSEVATIAGLASSTTPARARPDRRRLPASSTRPGLQLDDTERAHLLDLARAADGIPTSGRPRADAGKAATRLEPAVGAGGDHRRRRVRPRPPPGPARHQRPRPRVLLTRHRRRRPDCPNLARFQFLDPASRDFYPDWDLFAEMCVGIMRAEAGRDPHDSGLQDLVGELSTRSETFRRLWAAHNVRTHGTGTKRFHHPVVGELSNT